MPGFQAELKNSEMEKSERGRQLIQYFTKIVANSCSTFLKSEVYKSSLAQIDVSDRYPVFE
jgi:hypothetical protein